MINQRAFLAHDFGGSKSCLASVKDLLVCYNMVASIAQCEQLQEQLGAKGGGYKIRVGTRKNMDPSLW